MALILLLSYSGSFGGAERVLLDYAGGLGGERVLACPEGPLADAAAAAGLRVMAHRAGPLRLRGSLATRLGALAGLATHAANGRSLVAALDPDLVVASGMRTALALLGPGRLRAPVVVDHHDLLPGPLVARALRRAAARADLVIVPSQAVADDLGAGHRTSVIHPGVALERFDPAAPPEAPPLVLTLGAIVAWKRPELAVAAVRTARRALPELRLRLAGGPVDDGEELLARLRAEADSRIVELPGRVDDVPGELARAACLLHCALREPFGLALVEAMAAGRPVVAPDAGGPAEILDGACGVLYPPGDAGAAGAALAELLGNPERARAMGAAGRERAAARFDVRVSQKRFATAVTPLVRPRPARDSRALGIVTVSHNSATELEALLESVMRHLPRAELVVVDCASGDDSVAVASRCGQARVLELGENIGFGAACNRGVAALDAPVCALLNPDVELLDDSLLALVGKPSGALLAPLVLGADGARQDTVHPVPGSWAELARALLPYTVAGPVALAPWRARSPRKVGWAVGAALVAPTEVLRRLGPFDERIFMYGEDLELCLRARAAGVPTRFDPRARVLHRGGHTVAEAFGGEPFARRARMRREVVGRQLGRAAGAREDVAAAVTFATRIAARRLLGRGAERELAQLRALRELWRGG